MKTIKFDLRLSFSDDIKPEQLPEIVESIGRALKAECMSGEGLAPEDGETYTEEIEISHINIHKPLKINP